MRSYTEAEHGYFDEAARRRQILAEIALRVESDGPRVAAPGMARARQFMPFAALKGFSDMAEQVASRPEPRLELSGEQLAELNETVGRLECGDMLQVTYYDRDRYVRYRGQLQKLDFARRALTVEGRCILFQDVRELQVL